MVEKNLKCPSGSLEGSGEPAGAELLILRRIFAFGIPNGRSKIQKAIARFLDGDDRALDKCPAIRAHFDRTARMMDALCPDPDAPEWRKAKGA